MPGALGKIAVRLYSPERVVLEVEVPGTGKAVLASTERYAAYWKARVVDAPAEVFRVNLYFRGVFVSPGETHNHMEVRPVSVVPARQVKPGIPSCIPGGRDFPLDPSDNCVRGVNAFLSGMGIALKLDHNGFYGESVGY